ncbi:DEAD/DEAH box helicase [Peribacillus simplex]|uniref:DEAD/DEAH box helicase n=1 Tax=Peribacillus simplex TaxID=1478 RepID=UPI003D2C58E3
MIWENRAILSKRLRDYQIKAINKSVNYIKSSSSDHALIKMPTGTGKTFIIGVLSCFIQGVNNVLIVSPSEAIRSQLFKELTGNLWRKMNIEDNHEKSIYQLFPKNINNLIQIQNKKVLITTIQALTKIRSEKTQEYNQLKEQIDLVLFDEGHKEPASSWSQSIRNLKKKTILFSATPIRNDRQLFNVDEKFFFNYSINEAINKEIVRDVRFKIIDQQHSVDEEKMENFINNLIKLREEYINQENFEPKVILRFDNFDDIVLAYQLLTNKGKSVIAIHDRFKETKDNDNLFQNVPISTNDATYWIHQNKLVEGIDNSNFAILGLYGAFDNARSLIQQIGRIIRRDEINPPKESWVIVNTDAIFQRTIWETFCESEKVGSYVNKIPSLNFKNLFDELIKIQPSFIYEAKRFLKRFNHNKSISFKDTLLKYRLPLKANIFSLNSESDENTTYEALYEDLLKEKELNNEIVIHPFKNPDKPMSLIVYSRYSNSPILNDESFIEVKLNLCFFWLHKGFVFFFDTNNKIPYCILQITKPLNSNLLHGLFNQDSEFTQVTLRNGVISHNNIQRQVLNSRNMKDIAPNVTDKYNFCTTVTGRIEESGKKKRRYIGFSNSRVSDNSTYIIFKEYLDWIENISRLLTDGQISQTEFFDRFAPIIDEPEDPTPIRILLDLSDLEDHIINQKGETINVENLSYKVENNLFNIKIADETLSVSVEYKNNKYSIKFIDTSNNHKFTFNEEILSDEYSIQENDSLIDFLNRYQHFQIITQDVKHIYYKKVFYKAEIPSNDTRLASIFNEYSLINNKKIKSEKGDLSTVSDEWSDDSLFYLVSSLGKDIDESNGESYLKKNLEKMDYLICTDLQKEIADFIGVNVSEKQIYFIHCKAKDAKYSASVFQDVCGQVMKNLDYAHPLSLREPNDLDMWNGNWEKENVTRRRIIKGNLSSQEIWKEIKEIQKDSESVTNIWALTGKMFSLETYLAQKSLDTNQYPEIIQIDYLLMNTLAAAQSVGAKFKVIFDKKA